MTNDLYDVEDVAAPHFEERLWQELAVTHAAVRAGSHSPPAPRPDHRPGRGRRRLLVATGAIATLAAAVTAVVILRTDDPDRSRDPGTRTGTPDEVDEEGAGLADQISEAERTAAADSIVHIYQDARGEPQYNYDSESWYDETTGWRRDLQYDLDGEPSYDHGAAQAPSPDEAPPPPIPPDATPFDPSLPSRRTRTVDHCFSEYLEADETAIPGVNSSENIGEQLAEGRLIEDGTENVGGRELIRLIQTLGSIDEPSDPQTTITVEESTGAPVTARTYEAEVDGAAAGQPGLDEILMIYFVDPETFRPVMHVGYPGTQPDYSDASYVMTHEYLPRTAENMAQLEVPLPPGYTQVPQLRGDGERVDAGCI